MQLDDVLCYILFKAFNKEIHKNPTADRLDEHLIFDNPSIVFGKIIGPKKFFDTKISNFRKKIKKKDSQIKEDFENEKILKYTNNHLWEKTSNSKLKLFKFAEEEERMMSSAIDRGNKELFFKLAHEGLVTEKFLEAMMSFRTLFEEKKKNNNTTDSMLAVKEMDLGDGEFF